MSDFIEKERPVGKYWQHTTKPMWVVHYKHSGFYQAYRVKDYELPVPNGRELWSLDNRKLSQKGFPTLEAAMQAIRDAS